MKFTKMQGCGNDYVYMDVTKGLPEDIPALARRVSDRHFGIGSDGLILIAASDKADFRMIMYNSDGTEGAMCGNGIRCVGKYVYDHGMTDRTEIDIETKYEVKHLSMTARDGKVTRVRVDMGAPAVEAEKIPVAGLGSPVIEHPVSVLGQDFRMTCISVGNPHAILWVDDVDTCPLETVGPELEKSAYFPDRCNIEFVQIIDDHTVRMRVWERGAGETMACGTGATATAYACLLAGRTGPNVTVRLLGGDLTIEFDRESGHLFMTGPAVTVFEGELY